MASSTVMIHETAIVDDDVAIEAGAKMAFAHILPHTTVGSGSGWAERHGGTGREHWPRLQGAEQCGYLQGCDLEKDVFCRPSCVTNVLTPAHLSNARMNSAKRWCAKGLLGQMRP